MAKPAVTTIQAGAQSWDATANGNFAILAGANPAPIPELDWATQNEGNLPAATLYARCAIMVKHTTLGPCLALSDGVAWSFVPFVGTRFGQKEAVVTVGGAPVASIVTVGSVIPAGCFLLGVTVRVLVAAGNTWDAGDGATQDLFAVGKAAAVGTTSDYADHKNTWAPLFKSAAAEVTITGNAGNLAAAASFRVRTHFISIVAPAA